MLATFLGLYNYWIVIVLMMTGFYMVIAYGNLIKKVVGLSVFQTSVIILYVSMGKVPGGAVYSNPLPQVLMLTAIVVGIATVALALALIVRINDAYGSTEEEEIHKQDDTF
jgi:multicomponent Na+:H+ antiporter subunit C